ncbi:hypothetical protein ANCCEY_11409 [Ancylostoma ceylanicum]|uniref:Uncharacterized protein n=1 Tax=Ancylostoma ceylanicum TaxID=53326 RepID=A0A0D6LE78_9BILA|nr:hypothetical protein ANCCEY_11409 [Ancylostoma ceylanicum]
MPCNVTDTTHTPTEGFQITLYSAKQKNRWKCVLVGVVCAFAQHFILDLPSEPNSTPHSNSEVHESKSSDIVAKVLQDNVDTAPFYKQHLIRPFVRGEQLGDTYLDISEGTDLLVTGEVEKSCEALQAKNSEVSVAAHRLVIVEDPFSRFFTTYAKKCFSDENGGPKTCLGCDYSLNIFCFLNKLHNILNSTSHPIGPAERDIISHFAPASWFCNFPQDFTKYTIVKYYHGEEVQLSQQLDDFFTTAGVEQNKRDRISAEITGMNVTSSEMRTVVEQQVRISERLSKMLVRLYYYDYLLFGFSLPRFM